VLGVENEAGVEDAGDRRRRLVLEEHVVEVRRVPEVVARMIASSPWRRRWKAATQVGSLAMRRTTESQLLLALETSRAG